MAQDKWLVDGPKTIDIESIRKLKVSMIGGAIDIVAHDEPGARVEVHSVSGRDLLIAIDGDTLEIDHPQLGWDNWLDVFKSFNGKARAEISVLVPRDVALKLGSVQARVLVSGLTEDANLSSVSGDMVVDHIAGDVELHSVSGELSVNDHYGKVTTRTVSGDITATGTLHSFGGDTVSGDVFLDVTGEPDRIRVNTVSGSVTARLDSVVATSYRINTVSGKLQLDESEITGVRGLYTGKYGELDRRYLEFSANTVSGDVNVLHAVQV